VLATAPSITPVPWMPPAVESLDLPPSVVDFSEPSVSPADATALPADLMAITEPARARTSARWPMVAGALAVAAAIAFLALRPRAQVESLEPKPLASAPIAAKRAAPGPAGAVTGAEASRPQITPVVPPGPSVETADVETKPTPAAVVPAAPKLSGLPTAALGSMSGLDIPTDPTAPSRQKALEETRRQIETQMQR